MAFALKSRRKVDQKSYLAVEYERCDHIRQPRDLDFLLGSHHLAPSMTFE
jgi:hypothetical protein